jgi:plastocyanin
MFICLLHRAGMTGQITVVEKSKPLPTADQVKQSGAQELDKLVKTLQPAFDQLAKATPSNALAGNLTEAAQNAGVSAFGPKDISIPVGGTVTWTVLGPHTISFNTPEDAKSLKAKAPDGTIHLNPKAGAPANSPGQPLPPPNAAPAKPGSPPTLINAGSWDGSGFHSSGVIVSIPPDLFAYQLAFTKAGTYQFKCLIHDNMEGTVKVGS